jgi:hypothetical protein
VAAAGGAICQPTCDPGFAACGAPASGCTVAIDSDPDHCGDCGRACAGTNVSGRACSAGICRPTCAPPYADCSQPPPTATDDGCETNATLDPGEPDDACYGQVVDVAEGASSTHSTSRILPAGDVDVFTVNLHEGSHSCFPLTGQSYQALVVVSPPASTSLTLEYDLSGCQGAWESNGTGGVCISWGGTCSVDDSRTYAFRVSGTAGQSSCAPYTLSVTYCPEGQKCPGCP